MKKEMKLPETMNDYVVLRKPKEDSERKVGSIIITVGMEDDYVGEVIAGDVPRGTYAYNPKEAVKTRINGEEVIVCLKQHLIMKI